MTETAVAAERERLAHREQMLGEVKNELDDAFQFAGADGSRHGYVTREWIQALLATYAASAAAAERERCIALAEEHQARYDQTKPCGCGRTRNGRPCTVVLAGGAGLPFADLLRGTDG